MASFPALSRFSTETAEPVSSISVISLLQFFWSASSAASRKTSAFFLFYNNFLGANIPMLTTETLPRILTLASKEFTFKLDFLKEIKKPTNEFLYIENYFFNYFFHFFFWVLLGFIKMKRENLQLLRRGAEEMKGLRNSV
jgi:hypothetical protein